MSSDALFKTILAIDDDPGQLLLAEEVLNHDGYKTVTVSSGEAALSQIHEIDPDLILLDIMMPTMDGYETCRRIKAIPDYRYTPIIVLTGRNDIEAVERSFRSGAWDFTSKPINWPILKYRIRYALAAADAFANEHKSARLSRTIDNSPSDVLIFKADTMKIMSANASALTNLGYTEKELQEMVFSDVSLTENNKSTLDHLRLLEDNSQLNLECRMQRKNGTTYPAERIVIYSIDEQPYVYIGVFQDITEKKIVEEKLHKLAFYDELTGLPNRRLLKEHVKQALAVAKRKQGYCAICILDLDGFKNVNDTLGHSAGDLLLKEVSLRLNSVIRPYDQLSVSREDTNDSTSQLARLGGDEFFLLLTEFEDPGTPAKVANRVLQALSVPYNIHKTEICKSSKDMGHKGLKVKIDFVHYNLVSLIHTVS